MNTIALKNKKIILVFHEVIPVGPAHDLRDYFLLQNINELLFISHPLLYNKKTYKNNSYYQLYRKEKKQIVNQAHHWQFPELMLYVKDVLYTIFWVMRYGRRYDLFIGFNPLNAFTGLLLKKLRVVNKVVYYSIDYFTQRFSNPIINKMYHIIDKLCVKYADETWNISSVMVEAREKYNHMMGSSYKRQFTVPIGVWYRKAKRKSFQKINKNKIIFSGYLVPILGVDLVLQAIPQIKKQFPLIQFEIIGGGPELERLKHLVKVLHIEEHITFHGWIEDRLVLQRILSDAAIGVAPFNTKIVKDEIKNADPAKLKDYMVAGLPIIVTNAIANPDAIQNAQCGIVIPYDKNAFAEAVILLLKNEKLLKQYRKNALRYVKQFDNQEMFDINIERVFR